VAFQASPSSSACAHGDEGCSGNDALLNWLAMRVRSPGPTSAELGMWDHPAERRRYGGLAAPARFVKESADGAIVAASRPPSCSPAKRLRFDHEPHMLSLVLDSPSARTRREILKALAVKRTQPAQKQFRFHGVTRVPHATGIIHPQQTCCVNSFRKWSRRTDEHSSPLSETPRMAGMMEEIPGP